MDERHPPNNASKHVAAMTDRLAERISPTNRAFVEAGIRQRRNQNLKRTSIYNWAHAMAKLDHAVAGRAFADLSADDLSRHSSHTGTNSDPAACMASRRW